MHFLQDELTSIKRAGLYRRLIEINSKSGPRVRVDGRQVVMMASNDYLGLCAHPRLKQSAQKALKNWGAGSAASRLVSGNLGILRELEERLSRFKQKDAALVFSTGYMANLGLISALGSEGDVIYSDELNHASIIDGCRLSRADVKVFPHRDVNALETLMKKSASPGGRRIVITDGVFSMDGDLAPLPDIVELAERYDAVVIVDDAHGTGVLGEHGRGIVEHFGLNEKIDVIMGTMGKAMGCFGAFVAGSAALREYLINRARSFIFTTALPPAVIGSAIEALKLMEEEPQRRDRLWQNVSFFKEGLRGLGFNTLESVTQIIPLIVGESTVAVTMTERLLAQGLFIQAIRPPAVPAGTSRLRITLMATHTKEDLEFALKVIEKVGKELKII